MVPGIAGDQPLVSGRRNFLHYSRFVLSGWGAHFALCERTAQAAIYPYTEAGKRDTCLSNLKVIALGMQQYLQDYDDRYPVPESPAGIDKTTARMTWVALLQPYTKQPVFQC